MKRYLIIFTMLNGDKKSFEVEFQNSLLLKEELNSHIVNLVEYKVGSGFITYEVLELRDCFNILDDERIQRAKKRTM